LLRAINFQDHARERRIFCLHPQADGTHAGLVDSYAARDAMVDSPRQIQNQRIMVIRRDLGIRYRGSYAQLNADFRFLLNSDVYTSHFGPGDREVLGGSSRHQQEKNRHFSHSHHFVSSPGLDDYKRHGCGSTGVPRNSYCLWH
jgi:hypothetical protein